MDEIHKQIKELSDDHIRLCTAFIQALNDDRPSGDLVALKEKISAILEEINQLEQLRSSNSISNDPLSQFFSSLFNQQQPFPGIRNDSFAVPMKYKVEFKDNMPVRAILVRSAKRIDNLTDFGEKEGKSSIEFLYVDAESEQDAIDQAKRIATTIFKF